MAHMLVRADLEDFDAWKADFEAHHSLRAEHGGLGYQLFRDADDPNRVTVLLNFESAEKARSWNEYLEREGDLAGAGMSNVEFSYLDLVEEASTTGTRP